MLTPTLEHRVQVSPMAKQCVTVKALAIQADRMGENPTIAFRANSIRQKAEWERAVDGSEEYDSISHLIRKAVNRELAGTSSPSSESPDTAAMDKIQETVERMEARLQEVGQSVERVENQAYSEGGLSEETLQAVFAELPMGEGQAASQNTTVENIAEQTELDPATVELTLEQLRNDMKETVRYVELPPGRIWFREG